MSLLLLWFVITGGSAIFTWCGVAVFSAPSVRLPIFAILLGVCAIATTARLAGGLSREGAAGTIIAASLGLFGSVVVWLFAIDLDKGVKVAVCAFAFSLALAASYFEAAQRRSLPETYAFWRAQCAPAFIAGTLPKEPLARLAFDASFGRICGTIFANERATLLDER